jgi:hypothetical protein
VGSDSRDRLSAGVRIDLTAFADVALAASISEATDIYIARLPAQLTEMLYELETGSKEDDWPSDFVYDAEHDLYRFPDGEFAFSREYANERRLREMGIIG